MSQLPAAPALLREASPACDRPGRQSRILCQRGHVQGLIEMANLESRTHELQRAADPSSKEQQQLIEEMRAHLKKLQDMKKAEDPRLSFSTPEFKEAQRVFTDNFKKNFGRPVEWALVKDHPWAAPSLRKLDQPVDGQAWAKKP